MNSFSVETANTPSSWLILNHRPLATQDSGVLKLLLFKLQKRFQRNIQFDQRYAFICSSVREKDGFRDCYDGLTSASRSLEPTSLIFRNSTRSEKNLLMSTKRHYNTSLFAFIKSIFDWPSWQDNIDYLIWFPYTDAERYYSDYQYIWLQLYPNSTHEDYSDFLNTCKPETCILIDNYNRDAEMLVPNIERDNRRLAKMFYLDLSEHIPANFVLHADCPDREACEHLPEWKEMCRMTLQKSLISVTIEIVLDYVHPRVHACCNK